jgi:hypothetical protein
MPPRNFLISLNLQKIAHFWVGNLSMPFMKPRMGTRLKPNGEVKFATSGIRAAVPLCKGSVKKAQFIKMRLPFWLRNNRGEMTTKKRNLSIVLALFL